MKNIQGRNKNIAVVTSFIVDLYAITEEIKDFPRLKYPYCPRNFKRYSGLHTHNITIPMYQNISILHTIFETARNFVFSLSIYSYAEAPIKVKVV